LFWQQSWRLWAGNDGAIISALESLGYLRTGIPCEFRHSRG
jgi:hypothetical protein